MTDEPYRWLEAIQNRRDYIQDQLGTATSIAVQSSACGILLATPSTPSPKLFEIHDRIALAALGHPADIERLRQAAIDAAHLEAFNRSPADVSARRLAQFVLAPVLKTAFEQIFAAPLLFRGLLVELGESPDRDVAWFLNFDGHFAPVTSSQLRQGYLLHHDSFTLHDGATPEPAASTEWARAILRLDPGAAEPGIALLNRELFHTSIAFRYVTQT